MVFETARMYTLPLVCGLSFGGCVVLFGIGITLMLIALFVIVISYLTMGRVSRNMLVLALTAYVTGLITSQTSAIQSTDGEGVLTLLISGTIWAIMIVFIYIGRYCHLPVATYHTITTTTTGLMDDNRISPTVFIPIREEEHEFICAECLHNNLPLPPPCMHDVRALASPFATLENHDRMHHHTAIFAVHPDVTNTELFGILPQ